MFISNYEVGEEFLVPKRTSYDPLWNVLLEHAIERKIMVVLVRRIVDRNTGKKIRGMWSQHENKDVIFIDFNQHSDKKNHTLAHELGHSVMHRDVGFDDLSEPDLKNKIEVEAEVFAYALIDMMKENDVIDYDALGNTVKEAVRAWRE